MTKKLDPSTPIWLIPHRHLCPPELMKNWERDQDSDKSPELRHILAQHKLWIDSNGEQGERLVIHHADLRGAKVVTSNLEGCDLSGNKIQRSNLRGSDFSESDFAHSKLRAIKIRDNTDLTGTDFRGTTGGRGR